MKNKPPEEKAPGLGRTWRRTDVAQTEDLSEETLQALCATQAKKEKARLWAEWERTGDRRHLVAYGRHVDGMSTRGLL